MASSIGTRSGSSPIQSFEDRNHDHHAVIDQRTRKRMLSNRESARRSRMRKQKHLDDLMAQMARLRAENNQILTNMNVVTQLYLSTESENSVLRAQMSELNDRFQSLIDVVSCMNSNNMNASGFDDDGDIFGKDGFLNPWSLVHVHQPIMASPDVFMC